MSEPGTTDEPDVSLPLWRDPAWRTPAEAWVDSSLAAVGRARSGPSDTERLTPWSAVWRVPTDDGPVWFKGCSSGVAHEVRLYEVLARRTPDHVLPPVAADEKGRRLLLPDGGRTLRQTEGPRGDVAALERMLVDYAGMQRDLEPWTDELLDCGLEDRGPLRLAEVRAALLADDQVVLLGSPDGLSVEQRAELLAEQPAYEAQCADLAAYGIPLSLQHDDLHDNNVFATPDGHLRVFDWGDAIVGHPFGVLLISLRVIGDLLGVPDGAPALARLRDAYLEPWTDRWDRADLRAAAGLAVRVQGVGRADCYRRALQDWPRDRSVPPYAEGVAGWLLEQRGPMPV